MYRYVPLNKEQRGQKSISLLVYSPYFLFRIFETWEWKVTTKSDWSSTLENWKMSWIRFFPLLIFDTLSLLRWIEIFFLFLFSCSFFLWWDSRNLTGRKKFPYFYFILFFQTHSTNRVNSTQSHSSETMFTYVTTVEIRNVRLLPFYNTVYKF